MYHKLPEGSENYMYENSLHQVPKLTGLSRSFETAPLI